jgi:hypothetical protein
VGRFELYPTSFPCRLPPPSPPSVAFSRYPPPPPLPPPHLLKTPQLQTVTLSLSKSVTHTRFLDVRARCDVTRDDDVAQVLAAASKAMPGFCSVVNTAGTFLCISEPFSRFPFAHKTRHYNHVHIHAKTLCSPGIAAKGEGESDAGSWGRILDVNAGGSIR